MSTWFTNSEENKIEIYFKNIPSSTQRQALKERKWYWNSAKKCWFNRDSEENRRFAATLATYGGAVSTSKPTASHGKCGNNAFWVFLNNGTLLIMGSGEIQDFSYDESTSLQWQKLRSEVAKIIISDNITAIGKRAFCCFENLLEVNMSKSIKRIGPKAFSHCSKLKAIDLPCGLNELGEECFRDCVSLSEIIVPYTVEKIGNGIFRGWTPQQQIHMERKDPLTGSIISKVFVPKDSKKETQQILFEDFVAMYHTNYCTSQGHRIDDINAQISYLKPNGEIDHQTIQAGYCHQCHHYFIHQHQYERLRSLGVLICQLITFHEENKSQTGYYETLSAESILKRAGYNVNKEEALTSAQRHRILTLLMESKICQRNKIISHLSWLIRSHEGRDQMRNAISNWEEDIRFVEKYEMGSARTVIIKMLKVKN